MFVIVPLTPGHGNIIVLLYRSLSPDLREYCRLWRGDLLRKSVIVFDFLQFLSLRHRRCHQSFSLHHQQYLHGKECIFARNNCIAQNCHQILPSGSSFVINIATRSKYCSQNQILSPESNIVRYRAEICNCPGFLRV